MILTGTDDKTEIFTQVGFASAHRLSVCLFVCLSVCLHACMCVCMCFFCFGCHSLGQSQ